MLTLRLPIKTSMLPVSKLFRIVFSIFYNMFLAVSFALAGFLYSPLMF